MGCPDLSRVADVSPVLRPRTDMPAGIPAEDESSLSSPRTAGGARFSVDRLTAWFVWLCWAGLTALTGGLVLWFGIRIPYWDEWDAIVPFVAGDQQLTWDVLWGPHNEHRILIPRLILAGLDRLTGHEFRAGMFASLFCLSVVSAGLLLLIRHLRGRWSWTDAFFPLLLLNWGHAANLVMSFQIQLVLAGCLACVATALVAGRDRPQTARLALLGLILAAWPLCSAAGIVCGLAMLPYFGACLLWRSDGKQPESNTSRAVAGFFLIAIPVECLLAFVPRQTAVPPAGDVVQLLRHAFLECGMVFGAAVQVIGYPLALASIGLSAAALYWLWRGGDRSNATRLPRLGLALVIVAHLGLAAAIAWGRSGMGDRFVLAPRYVTLLCPLLVAVYLAAVRYAPGRWGHLVAASLCLAHVALYPANLIASWPIINERKTQAAALVQEIGERVPLPELVRRHSGFFHPRDEVFEHQIRRLHDAQIGVFAGIQAAGDGKSN